MEERIIDLEKEIRTKVDETRVIEMIKEVQLEKNPSKVISPNEVKEVVQMMFYWHIVRPFRRLLVTRRIF